ncbi:hypothetical protein POJ06DRAFT_267283 [Lipomyces tetrasporus]|uniref:Transmembrane protein 135 N-terminal domain-containing protein n=1 Tax=Lipomyces tetrasporus TaxID=54092 RepID=A0AAD7QWJ2_9ASCO|nr:uncharacterized protein POJ06DRAFT_267283 [Lipomyces tetrasporus]KAJ8101117.1 hypothetical protein POJ06DRAFT_267283 [Lipomyces tetrasporus]
MSSNGHENRRELVAYITNYIVSPMEYQTILRKATNTSLTIRGIQKSEEKENVVGNKITMVLPSLEEVMFQSKNFSDFYISMWRASTRLYAGSYTSLSLIEYALYLAKKGPQPRLISGKRTRASVSVTMILVTYRLLYRFTMSLHTGIASSEARKFRRRHRRIARALRSPYFVPFTSGILSGSFVYFHPAGRLRSYAAFYCATLAVEYMFNYVTTKKQFAFLRQQAGVWILFPFSMAQLLHTFTYDLDCCNNTFKRFMMKFAPNYIPLRPANYPTELSWPAPLEIIDSMKNITLERYPPFNSPILYPDSYTLPSNFRLIDPIVSQAHPGIEHLSCALMHPYDESCLRSFAKSSVAQFGQFTKYVGGIYALTSLVSYKKFKLNAKEELTTVLKSFLRTNLFLTMTTATAWAGLCASQYIMPNKLMPQYRVKVIGFLAGLWAFIDQNNGKAKYIPVARMAFESYWKTLVKHKKIRTIPHGDAIVFAVSLALIMTVYDKAPQAIESDGIKKIIAALSGNEPVEVPVSVPQTPLVERKFEK